jgi:hypothetical protein
VFELLETAEAAGYLLGFWGFLFSSRYRAQVLARWRAADLGTRARLGLDGIISTTIGLGVPAVILWVVLI